jgi:hypothetical protein
MIAYTENMVDMMHGTRNLFYDAMTWERTRSGGIVGDSMRICCTISLIGDSEPLFSQEVVQ